MGHAGRRGVTQRANSVWPRDPGPQTTKRQWRAATQWYRNRRLPLIFQVFNDERSAGLNAVLDAQRFSRQSETLIMVRAGRRTTQRPAGRLGERRRDLRSAFRRVAPALVVG